MRSGSLYWYHTISSAHAAVSLACSTKLVEKELVRAIARGFSIAPTYRAHNPQGLTPSQWFPWTADVAAGGNNGK